MPGFLLLGTSLFGELLTRWAVRLALSCFVLYLAGALWGAGRARWWRVSRWIWTAGCGWMLLHVACAFHFYHHWSHGAAWQSTADETQRMLGVAFGDGIYASYLFLLAWAADVVWLWTFSSPPRAAAMNASGVPGASTIGGQTPIWRLLVHFFLLFIAFNGAIVFEGGPTRWAGIVASLALAALAGRRAYNWLARGSPTNFAPPPLGFSKNPKSKSHEPPTLVQ